MQKKVDAGKKAEWDTLTSKPDVLRVHYGKAAARIKQQFPHRFIGSRFVLIPKPWEEGKEICLEDPLVHLWSKVDGASKGTWIPT